MAMCAKKQELAVKMLAANVPQTQIAEKFGVTQSGISKFASKDEIKKLIEAAELEYYSYIPDAIELSKQAITDAKGIDKATVMSSTKPEILLKIKEIGLKEGAKMLTGVGIQASHTQARIVQNIYNDNRTQVLSPVMRQFLGGIGDSLKISSDEDNSEPVSD